MFTQTAASATKITQQWFKLLVHVSHLEQSNPLNLTWCDDVSQTNLFVN